MKVVPLFAIPFLVEEYPQSFDDELKYIRSLPINGTHSEDSFVLDKPELKLIRDWIKDRIDFYIINISIFFNIQINTFDVWFRT